MMSWRNFLELIVKFATLGCEPDLFKIGYTVWPLDLPQAAIDAKFSTGDVARVIAQQEQGGCSHF